jgi:hypothetical protein
LPQCRRRSNRRRRRFIAALEPAKLTAAVAAAERLEADREAALKPWRLAVERASYEAQRAERRYRAVDPENRLVARGLEREWEESLKALEAAKADLARHESERRRTITEQERSRLLAIGPDLFSLWNAMRRLAAHYPDAVIAGVLNRQGSTTAYGYRFDRNPVFCSAQH